MFDTYIAHLVDQYRERGVVVDTNLMVLIIVGTYDINKIESFRATRKYSPAIYNAVIEIVHHFPSRYTTPNIFTEVDNLSKQVDKTEWEAISFALNTIIATLMEVPTPTIHLASHPLHCSVGITDCSILNLAAEGMLVLTDDLPLSSQVRAMGRDVINVSNLIA